MSNLDKVLKGWSEARAAAIRQVERHRALGFPATALPDQKSLCRASLAALGARSGLEASIRPDMDLLRAKGVLDSSADIRSLSVGVLSAIELVRPYLVNVLDLADSLTQRAFQAEVMRTSEDAPSVRMVDKIEAAFGQPVFVEIEAFSVDRILVHATGSGRTLILTPPPELLVLDMYFYPGELLVFAENDAGYCKLVCPMEVGSVERHAADDRRMSRTANDRGQRTWAKVRGRQYAYSGGPTQ